jgi:hypothetical protein
MATAILFTGRDRPLVVTDEPGEVMRLLQTDTWVGLKRHDAGGQAFVRSEAVAYVREAGAGDMGGRS